MACTTLQRSARDTFLLGEIENPPIVGVFDEIPTMQMLRVPIVCSMQDIPALAEGCVTQILKLLEGGEQKIEPILLHAKVVTNRAFGVIQFGAKGGGAPK